MATDEECMAYARECVRLAGLTDEPKIRDQLFALAREWMAAAMQEARRADFSPVNQSSVATGHAAGREHRVTFDGSPRRCALQCLAVVAGAR